MSKSIAAINTILVDIKTVNNSLLPKLQQTGFKVTHHVGYEDEYTIKTLISSTDTLIIHFLTITASRNQFIQRTSYAERKEIESLLQKLYVCLKQTDNTLLLFNIEHNKIQNDKPLGYTDETGNTSQLPLVNAVDYIDMLKPYCRMLELIIAQERIHALSAVLENMLQKAPSTTQFDHDDHDLTEEQDSALQLSHYFVKQAL
jgi:hypothetical protein